MRPISVVISSLRPERLEETIDTISVHADLAEVVVVSPYPPKLRDNVVHVPVPAPGAPEEMTFCQKYNLGACKASGKYIIYNNDDIHFRPGWAPALLKHMEGVQTRPYLAAFHMARGGTPHTRYTIFGLLYGNHGCIPKVDLDLIGGNLLDERINMYYSEIDLAMRVWNAGGQVGMCEEVVLDIDQDVDQVTISQRSKFMQTEEKPAKEQAPKKKSYRDIWYREDTRTFYRLWFWKYFGLYLKHYKELRGLFSNDDGVLPPNKYEAGLLKVMLWPVFNMYLNPKILFARKNKRDFLYNHFVRVANRRWGTLSYAVPYSADELKKYQRKVGAGT